MSKELWFAEYERELNRLEDLGLPSDNASDLAADRAQAKVKERLLDHADYLRKRERENG